jgi:hypothetical protein
VTRGIDNQKTGDLELELAVLVDNLCLGAQSIDGEVSGTDLLGNTTGFTLLDIGLADLVKQLSLTSIDVTKNTANGRTEIIL